jgi:NAD(P)H dehydrogenase (quinone)
MSTTAIPSPPMPPMPKRYHIVFAHPEPRSLNGFLRDRAIAGLQARGHVVTQSDLYAMRFKATADAEDFPSRDFTDERLIYHRESGMAQAQGEQSEDIATEQARLLAADAIILQFPLWWFSMPAILKGWVDRVFATGFAIGVPKDGSGQWLRYGEGLLAGRRAMLAVTTGGREAQFGARGIHGPIDDLLFPINHGILHYVGLEVVAPWVAFQTTRLTEETADRLATDYVGRLLSIFDAAPIGYRSENGGDYDDRQVLKHDIPGGTGFAAHIARADGR